ncbi:class I SAM-dependent methyltransferase [Mycolicibacterium stellerae]|uniref:class I SAM-dependent methyltransferase n=1 Tax=Mycolicibacterium stellerae TaxID=2358193 RepID=UPI000F0B326E|nr:class I SAM-dependent methyltransferase [Mycolicibacterium stellerae]
MSGPDARAAYDAVATAYDAAFADELDAKPLDRALLTSFAELASSGTICDIGCGPGHVTCFLAGRHADVVGIDLSPAMVEIARQRAPDLSFTVGSILDLPVADDAWAGAVSLYSIIHLTPSDRTTACREFARVIRPGGWLLLAFHVDSPEFAVGAVNHLTSWLGQRVELDGYFLDPDDVSAQLEAAGFTVKARLEREPIDGVEYPSRRCYLLAER